VDVDGINFQRSRNRLEARGQKDEPPAGAVKASGEKAGVGACSETRWAGMTDMKIPLCHLSPSTTAFLERLRASGLDVLTQDDLRRIAGKDDDLARYVRALRQSGWLEGRVGRKSGKWYFRLR